MRRICLPLISDTLFYAAAVWLLSVGLLRYYRVPLWLSALCAALFGLAAGGTVFALGYRKRGRRALSKKQNEKREALMLHLALEKNERVRALLLEALTADGKEASCRDDALYADGAFFIPLFRLEPVSADAVAALLKEYGSAPFMLACNTLSQEAAKLIRDFGKSVLLSEDVFALLERTGVMPETLICGSLPRKTARTKARLAFSKKNARPFFVSGVLLLVMSLFTIFPLYYLICGAILMSAAVFVRTLGYGGP